MAFVKASRKKVLFVLMLLTVFFLSIAAFRHITGRRIVVQAVAPNGIEFCILQRFAGGDLFNTSAHYRKPGGPWGWFYVNHEDWYWNRGKADIDLQEKKIKIYRRGKLVASFEWETETFRLLPGSRRTVGAQTWMAAGRNPWDK